MSLGPASERYRPSPPLSFIHFQPVSSATKSRAPKAARDRLRGAQPERASEPGANSSTTACRAEGRGSNARTGRHFQGVGAPWSLRSGPALVVLQSNVGARAPLLLEFAREEDSNPPRLGREPSAVEARDSLPEAARRGVCRRRAKQHTRGSTEARDHFSFTLSCGRSTSGPRLLIGTMQVGDLPGAPDSLVM